MRFIAAILKAGAVIVGFLCIMWGLWVVLGGPEGSAPMNWRLVGLVILAAGVSYCIPNRRLVQRKAVTVAYLLGVAIPICMVIGFALWDIGHQSVHLSIGLVEALVLCGMLSLAPLSLLIEYLERGRTGSCN